MPAHNEFQPSVERLCNELIAVLVKYEMALQNQKSASLVKELEDKIRKLQMDISNLSETHN
jgi:hypothetical protein